MHICQKRGLQLDPQLFLDKSPIPVVDENKSSHLTCSLTCRLCLGAFRTSPVESLYVDAREPCLGAKRAKLSLQYASKIKSLPKHPAHNAVFDNKYIAAFTLPQKLARLNRAGLGPDLAHFSGTVYIATKTSSVDPSPVRGVRLYVLPFYSFLVE